MRLWKLSRSARLAAMALLGCFAPALFVPAWAQYSLKARKDFRVGDHPLQVITLDFDNDGQPDLISVDELSDSLSLMKGFGDGTFRQIGTVVTGTKPTAVAVADVNNDGQPDLVVANFQTHDITVNLGNGIGQFGPPIDTDLPTTPFSLTVGDWNADGKVDVAVVNTTYDSLSTLRGVGDGTFSNLTEIPIGDSPSQILSGDFNADAKADLVVINTGSSTVQVWRGNGLGAFTLNTTLSQAAGSGPVAGAIADLNGDTRPDLVICNRDAGNVKVYLANTSGGFLSPTTYSPGSGPRSVVIADLNKDGNLDLAVGMALLSGSGQVAVLNGNGAGGFGAAALTPTSPFPGSLSAADYNQDGNVDVVSASLTGNTLSLLETTATGAFNVAGKVQLAAGSFPASIVSADFNADGKPDVATANQLTDDVAVARGDGVGGFLAPTTVSTGTSSGPQALTTIDTNRDSKIDLVTVNVANTMSVLMNNGTGVFTATNGLSLAPCLSPVAITTGEINGDINADISLVCEESYHLCTRRGTGGSGSSAFGPLVCTLLDTVPSGVAMGQYDYDLLHDMAFTGPEMHWVEIAISDGFGGVLDIPATFPTGQEPRGVVRGDINGDSIHDLVVANANSATISALLGDGGGAFSFPSIQSPAGEAPVSVALADLNLDGKLDAAVVNANANNISFLLGDGFGNFTKAGDFGTRDLPLSVGVGDFNLDGKPDLAVADNFSDTITVLLNQSNLGDPLLSTQVLGDDRTVYRWGLVPGAVYDVIRANSSLVTQGPSTFNLGAVTCLANNLQETDLAEVPDTDVPPFGQAFIYLVRPVIAGVPGQYTVSTNGKPGVPSSGGCQ
jgi:hypothetical protein